MSPSSGGISGNTDDLRDAAVVIGQSPEGLRRFDPAALAVPGEQSGSPRMGSALQTLEQRWAQVLSDAVSECDWTAQQLSATADALQSSDLDAAEGLHSAQHLDPEWPRPDHTAEDGAAEDSDAAPQPESALPSSGQRWV